MPSETSTERNCFTAGGFHQAHNYMKAVSKIFRDAGAENRFVSVVTQGSSMDVPALEFTQKKADTRIILHTIYSVQNERVERVIIHANDTDIIFMCLYYGATDLSDLPEL